MSMRISDRIGRPSGFILLALAGCGDRAAAPDQARSAGGPRVACATGGATDLQPRCTVDRQQTARGLSLVIRHADGGFRRLLVTKDGRGVIAEDGAQAATVRIVDPATIEVALGGDVYRLPATVKAVRR